MYIYTNSRYFEVTTSWDAAVDTTSSAAADTAISAARVFFPKKYKTTGFNDQRSRRHSPVSYIKNVN